VRLDALDELAFAPEHRNKPDDFVTARVVPEFGGNEALDACFGGGVDERELCLA
jgi:hypothetical protein